MKQHHPRPLSLQGQRRRQLGRMALGAVAALGLAACGGGGGEDSVPSLREVYDRLQPGMTKKQVYDMVGRAPSNTSNTADFYTDGTQTLFVGFSPDANKSSADYLIDYANLYGAGSDISKTF